MTGEPITTAFIGATIASQALDTAGSVAASKQQERAAKLNARVGQIRANELDTALRSELNRTLGNIDAIRASSGLSPLSPTSRAIRGGNRQRSDFNRKNRVASERVQALQSREDAVFFRRAQRAAWTGLPFRSLASVSKVLA